MAEYPTESDAPAQGAMERGQTLLDFAVSQSPAIFYIAELEGERPVTFMSTNIETITGHQPSAFIDNPKLGARCIHPDDWAGFDQSLEELREKGASSHEFRFRRTTGDFLWFREELRLTRNEWTGRDEFVGCMVDITKEKHTEARLREAESVKTAIIESAQDAIVAIDEDGIILEFNPAAEQMFGHERSAAIGQLLSELIIPEQYRERHAEGVRRFKETGETKLTNKLTEIEAMRADGSCFPVEVTLAHVSLGERSIFVAEIADVSERVEAERERQRLSRLLHDAVESLPNGFSVSDAEGQLLICNKAFAEPYGLEPQSMVGKSRHELVAQFLPKVRRFDGKAVTGSEEDVQLWTNRIRALDAGPVEIELKNGEWKLITGNPTSDGGFAVVRTDITQQKKAETALRESEEHFRSIVESYPLPVWMVDVESGTILYESPAAAALMGREWPSQKPLSILNHYASPEERKPFLERLRQTGELRDYEVQLKKADGAPVWVLGNSRLISYKGREVVVSANLDLTERRQREAELKQARETLEDAIESLSSGFALYDADDRLVKCNYRYREFNPRSADALVAGVKRSDFHRIGAERGQYVDAIGRVEEWIAERTKALKDIEAKVIDKMEFQQNDGHWYEASIRPTRQGGTVVIRTDITQRKQMEIALRESEEHFRILVEGHPIPVWMVDLETAEILYESPAAAELMGREWPSEKASYTTDHVVYAGQREQVNKRLRETGEVRDYELQLKKADGTFVWVAINDRLINYQGREISVTSISDLSERKQAEEALRASEARFRTLVENSPICIHEIDLEGRLQSMNPTGLDMMGATDASAIRDRPYLDAVSEGDREQVGRLLSAAIAGERCDFEFTEASRRRPRVFASNFIPIKGEDGSVQKLMGMTTDITDRKQREDELRQARETLEDAIEALSEGFVLYDADDRFVMCNQRYREFNHLSADKLKLGVEWLDILRTACERGQYKDAIGRVDEYIEEHSKGGLEACCGTNVEFQQSDGRWFVGSRQRTRQGGTVGTRIDITERKRMEEALRESEARFRSISSAHPVPVAIVTVDGGEMLYVSKPWADLFGTSIEAVVGRHAEDYYANPADRARFIEPLLRDGAVNGFEVEFKRPDGSTLWVALTAKRCEFEGKDAIVTGVIDLTERRAAEQEIARQREVLHQSEKLSALGELLASVAHELNNPLSVVVGQALLLKETTTDEGISHRAVKIGNAADRCARIVKTFLAMARQQPTESMTVNMNDIIEATLDVTSYSLRASDIEVSLLLARELPLLHGDADQLSQVFTNLIVNGQHALEEKQRPRKLSISSAFDKSKDEVVVEVKDNGPGIPEEIRSRIFEPLFTTKEVGTGTGIGLAVCHRIIESHGGTITVESNPQVETSFVIRLPVRSTRKGETSVSKPVGEVPESLSALVIDDEADVAEMLGDILRSDGHRVEVVDSGAAALREIERREFDIILSDLRMPDLDGPGLYKVLEERRPALLSSVAFITGDTMSSRVRSFLQSTGRPYIEKPITPNEVRDLVRLINIGKSSRTRVNSRG